MEYEEYFDNDGEFARIARKLDLDGKMKIERITWRLAYFNKLGSGSFRFLADIARTDSEADGTVYKNSYASLMNDLPPTTSFDDFKQSISHLTDIFRSNDTWVLQDFQNSETRHPRKRIRGRDGGKEDCELELERKDEEATDTFLAYSSTLWTNIISNSSIRDDRCRRLIKILSLTGDSLDERWIHTSYYSACSAMHLASSLLNSLVSSAQDYFLHISSLIFLNGSEGESEIWAKVPQLSLVNWIAFLFRSIDSHPPFFRIFFLPSSLLCCCFCRILWELRRWIWIPFLGCPLFVVSSEYLTDGYYLFSILPCKNSFMPPRQLLLLFIILVKHVENGTIWIGT